MDALDALDGGPGGSEGSESDRAGPSASFGSVSDGTAAAGAASCSNEASDVLAGPEEEEADGASLAPGRRVASRPRATLHRSSGGRAGFCTS